MYKVYSTCSINSGQLVTVHAAVIHSRPLVSFHMHNDIWSCTQSSIRNGLLDMLYASIVSYRKWYCELLAAAITVAVEERLPHTEYRLSGRTEMSGTGKQ